MMSLVHGIQASSDEEEDVSDAEDDFSLADSNSGSIFDFHTGATLEDDLQDPGSVKAELKAEGSRPWGPLRRDDANNYIRVMRITPRSDLGKPIMCTLEATTLQDPVPYQALSYAWDKGGASEFVLIDGQPVPVSPGLHAALSRIRDHWDEKRLLINEQRPAIWVDKLCIDQDNLTEKSSQVLLMGQIFSVAERVLMWLGECADALENKLGGDLYDRFIGHYTEVDQRIVDDGTHRLFINKPYFKRRWVIQEVTLQRSRLILFGPWYFDPNILTRGYYTNFNDWVFRDDSKGIQRPLLHNLAEYAETNCTNDLDRIFALRSISSDGDRFPVDYRRSVKETYFQLAVTYARSSLLPLLLRCAAITSRRVKDKKIWPTWVPDWRLLFPGVSPASILQGGSVAGSVNNPVVDFRHDAHLELEDSLDHAALCVEAWAGDVCRHRWLKNKNTQDPSVEPHYAWGKPLEIYKYDWRGRSKDRSAWFQAGGAVDRCLCCDMLAFTQRDVRNLRYGVPALFCLVPGSRGLLLLRETKHRVLDRMTGAEKSYELCGYHGDFELVLHKKEDGGEYVAVERRANPSPPLKLFMNRIRIV